MYQVYDDRNFPNDPTRWRVRQIRGVNTTPEAYYLYVYDPTTGQYYPGAPGSPTMAVVQPGGDTTWDVPASYQNRTVDDFTWGAGPIA